MDKSSQVAANTHEHLENDIEMPETRPASPPREGRSRFGIGVIVLFLIGIGIAYVVKKNPSLPFPPGVNPTASPLQKVEAKVVKFASEDEFKAYLAKSDQSMQYSGRFGLGLSPERMMFKSAPGVDIALPNAAAEMPTAGGGAQRVSETNVQVKGIDEPDIVKTDGTRIYKSTERGYFIEPMPLPAVRLESSFPMPVPEAGKTSVIKAFPPGELGLEGKIDLSGDLLLGNNILMIFSGNKLTGYDISNPKVPVQKWSMNIENNTQIVTARLYSNKVYLVTSTYIDRSHPCPLFVATTSVKVSIPCVDMYHPTVDVPVDTTYTVMVVDPQSGITEKTAGFVGAQGSSVVYMSPNALYVTYSYPVNQLDLLYGFYTEKAKDLISADVVEKLRTLKKLPISDSAKMVELQVILEKFQQVLSQDDRLKLENEINNRLQAYMKEHVRDLERTGIVKVDLGSLTIAASGGVSGSPLNQFSLDEYKGNVRIATTVNGSFGSQDNVNDVYVLKGDLSVAGSVPDLGLTERIYSARFIEDKGYIVTFRQTDPFYVLDLSDPQNPQKKGELKIPGYSSYLHPLAKNSILGVGKEGAQVKLSLFDVADPQNPKEVGKYVLNDYWSDILNTHHAFLQDEKHGVFFMPGGKGGYIFSYQNSSLSMVKAVSDIQARRALYLNDYLYIVGDDKLVVVNESDWQVVRQLPLN